MVSTFRRSVRDLFFLDMHQAFSDKNSSLRPIWIKFDMEAHESISYRMHDYWPTNLPTDQPTDRPTNLSYRCRRASAN